MSGRSPVISRDTITPKDDVLAFMLVDLVAAMRGRLPLYFAAVGTGDAEDFLRDMAKPLVLSLRSLAIEFLRDEQGRHLPPGQIDALVASTLTTATVLAGSAKESA